MKEEATVIASNNEINYNEAEETRTPFIIGNTQPIEMDALSDMLTPVFSRDNVETISHVEGISTITDAISTYFDGQQINAPIV